MKKINRIFCNNYKKKKIETLQNNVQVSDIEL